MRLRLFIVLLVSGRIAFVQSSATPKFEVASVKLDPIGTSEGPGKGREIIQVSSGNLSVQNITLNSALKWAYRLQANQISGPPWIDSERYLIFAKAGGPVSEDQLRLMLRNLLTERFKLALHWETRDQPCFVLVVGSRGAKLKVSKVDEDGGVRYGKGNSVIGTKASLSQFADALTNPLHGVVLDETGLPGNYDFTLDLNVYEPGNIAPEDMPVIINRGLQDQLGLKLESRKRPIEVLVIEQGERLPIQN